MVKKVILLSVLSLFLAGCNNQGTKVITGGMVSTNLNENTIQIKNYAYDPSDLDVKGGSTIKVTNSDSVAHTLTADDKSFDTGLVQPGQTVELKIPAKDGTFGFYCIPHPYMRGKFVVSGSPTPTPEE